MQDIWSDSTWQERYPRLQAIAYHVVYSLHISAWQGQEADLAEDIVQETIRRLMEHDLRTKRGEARQVLSLEHFMTVVAYNYGKDLRRHDLRIVRIAPQIRIYEYMHDSVDFSDVAIDNVYQEQLFSLIASEVQKFPRKQRSALLTDLANHSHFGEQTTPLQAAFLRAQIKLQEYQRTLPDDPIERARHSSLVSLAYKRLFLILRQQNSKIA